MIVRLCVIDVRNVVLQAACWVRLGEICSISFQLALEVEILGMKL